MQNYSLLWGELQHISLSLLSARMLRIGIAVLTLSAGFFLAPALNAQAVPAATRPLDLQVGANFDLAHSDYGSRTLYGFGFYSTLNFGFPVGIEADFHQLNDPGSKQGIYQRTYEIGPRYAFHFGRFSPYAKLMVGRGVFNFPPDPRHPENGSVANLAYNMWAGGFGADYRIRPSINLRVDYELQRWSGFPPDGLSPRVLSFGVAYHFH